MSLGAFLPLLILTVALAAAAHAPTRDLLETKLRNLFSYGFVRGLAVILIGAAFIQYLPLELALFAAGDVLAYVEVMAALSFIAAQTRVRAIVRIVAQRWIAPVVRMIRKAGRAVRAVRAQTPRKAPPPEPDGWVFA